MRQVAGGKEEDNNQDVHTAGVAACRHLAAWVAVVGQDQDEEHTDMADTITVSTSRLAMKRAERTYVVRWTITRWRWLTSPLTRRRVMGRWWRILALT